MKKINLLIIFLIVLFGFCSCTTNQSDDNNNSNQNQTENETETDDDLDSLLGYVNIFEVNDTHGAAFSDDIVTGLDKVETVIENLEKENGDYIKIANGDIFQGEYVSNKTQGLVFIELLNAMNFDCFVIGNHDFDWNLDVIAAYKDGDPSNGELNCPFLACNIIDKRTGARPTWIDEYTIVENNGYKVGIIGAIGDTLESSISKAMVENYEFVNADEHIKELTKELRIEKGCDAVILSIHEYDETHNATLAVPDGDYALDAIICGHTHQSIKENEKRNDGYMVPVIQSYTKNKNVGTIVLKMFDNQAISSTINHYVPGNYESSSKFAAIKEKYQSLIDESYEPLFVAENTLDKDTLGLMACNAMVKVFDADIGCVNTAGVRSTIAAGEVKEKDLLAAFPFDDEVYLVTLKGDKFREFVERYADGMYTSEGVDLSTVEDDQDYVIAIIDYAYTNGFCQRFFKDYEPFKTERYIRDVIAETYRDK